MTVRKKEHKFSCVHCGQNFVKGSVCRNHQASCAGPRNYKMPVYKYEKACTHCTREFPTNSNRNRHESRCSKRPGAKSSLQCGLCKQSYARSDSLKRHIREQHSTVTTLEFAETTTVEPTADTASTEHTGHSFTDRPLNEQKVFETIFG